VGTTSQLAAWRRLAAIALALLLVAAACGGGDDEEGQGDTGGDDAGNVEAPEEPDAEPTPGGKVVYGLEAETSGGYCLAEAQLAISGIQVARTMYDTLVAPNADGEYVPYLAESVESNQQATEFTITLRDGVQFHDGTPVNANVVANNLDAYRGTYRPPAEDQPPRPDRHGPGERQSLLFAIVLQNVTGVEVENNKTVVVTTADPWPAFPAFLFSSGRMGMMAQKQLDSDRCTREMIGTGPFELVNWRVDNSLTAKKNENYWQKDEAGNPLPYLDEIEYRPVTEGVQRVNGLQSGELTMMHTSGAQQIEQLRMMSDNGEINVVESDAFAEVSYLLVNSGEESEGNPRPLDSLNARLAVAHAIDRDRVNEVRGLGIPQVANGPFAPGSPGYVENTGFPEFDLEKAREFVQEYKDETGEQNLSLAVKSTPDPDVVASMDMISEMLEEAGIRVSRQRVEQAQLINTALSGDFDILSWRNHPGGDPDTQLVWWRSGYPTNFGRIDDPQVDRLLDRGRTETDEEKRADIYERLNKRMATQAYNIWMSHTIWAIGSSSDVFGVLGPPLPDGSDPFPGLATGHPVSGIWIEQ
jgi:peptide/nickel transport system substrate-binding protein